MEEKMKTILIAVVCILIIAFSAIGMDYARSEYSRQTIEFDQVVFTAPPGYQYVNGSYNETTTQTILNESNMTLTYTKYELSIQKNDDIVKITQERITSETMSGDIIKGNNIDIYKVSKILGSENVIYSFIKDGKKYTIQLTKENDQLAKDIANSIEAKQ